MKKTESFYKSHIKPMYDKLTQAMAELDKVCAEKEAHESEGNFDAQDDIAVRCAELKTLAYADQMRSYMNVVLTANVQSNACAKYHRNIVLRAIKKVSKENLAGNWESEVSYATSTIEQRVALEIDTDVHEYVLNMRYADMKALAKHYGCKVTEVEEELAWRYRFHIQDANVVSTFEDFDIKSVAEFVQDILTSLAKKENND